MFGYRGRNMFLFGFVSAGLVLSQYMSLIETVALGGAGDDVCSV
jgi:hypothetical protein